jgi:Endodeoxyribonuclease RusA
VAKRPLKLTLRIPPYKTPRNAWRKELHQVVLKRQRKSPVRYTEKDKLEVEVRLYIKGKDLTMHDVDNRLKDILDALQGRAGGPKKRRTLEPIIPNDRQIYRVIMQKGLPPWQSKGFGHLTIRKFGTWKFVCRFRPKRLKIQ